jgi:hypothetical protein
MLTADLQPGRPEQVYAGVSDVYCNASVSGARAVWYGPVGNCSKDITACGAGERLSGETESTTSGCTCLPGGREITGASASEVDPDARAETIAWMEEGARPTRRVKDLQVLEYRPANRCVRGRSCRRPRRGGRRRGGWRPAGRECSHAQCAPDHHRKRVPSGEHRLHGTHAGRGRPAWRRRDRAVRAHRDSESGWWRLACCGVLNYMSPTVEALARSAGLPRWQGRLHGADSLTMSIAAFDCGWREMTARHETRPAPFGKRRPRFVGQVPEVDSSPKPIRNRYVRQSIRSFTRVSYSP